MFGPLGLWRKRLASTEICIQQGDGQPCHRTRVFVAPSVSVQTFLAPRPKQQKSSGSKWATHLLGAYWGPTGPMNPGIKVIPLRPGTWEKCNPIFHPSIKTLIKTLIKTKHTANSKHMPDSLRVLILWIFFMGSSMYLSSKCGSFTDDEKRRHRRKHEKKEKQRWREHGSNGSNGSNEKKSENVKELNHQGEFDHCSETWRPPWGTRISFGPRHLVPTVSLCVSLCSEDFSYSLAFKISKWIWRTTGKEKQKKHKGTQEGNPRT